MVAHKMELDKNKPFVTYVKQLGVKNQSYPVTHSQANSMIYEGMATIQGETLIEGIFTKESLYIYIMKRDRDLCQMCGSIATKTRRLISDKQGGYSSPVNLIACCTNCLTQNLDLDWVAKVREENKLLFDVNSIRQKPVLLVPRGSASPLYMICDSCEETLFYQRFSYSKKEGASSSICAECQSKQKAEEIQVRKTQQKTIRTIMRNFYAYFKEARQSESSLLDDSQNEIYVIYKNGWEYGKVNIEIAKRYVDEGLSVFNEKYPFVIFNLYSQSYPKFRLEILERDHYICHYCGEYGDTLDHVLAESEGGLLTPKNSVCACFECNNEKSDMSYDEFILHRQLHGKGKREKQKILSSPVYKICTCCGEYRYYLYFEKRINDMRSNTCRLCKAKLLDHEKKEKIAQRIIQVDAPDRYRNIMAQCSVDLTLLEESSLDIWHINFANRTVKKTSVNNAISRVLKGQSGILSSNSYVLIDFEKGVRRLRKKVIEKHNNRCIYCSRRGDVLTQLHERHDRFSYDESEWVVACPDCSRMKGSKTHEQFLIIAMHARNARKLTETHLFAKNRELPYQ